MSPNSSFSSNASLPPPTLSSFLYLQSCMKTTVGLFNITAFTITSILIVLPLCMSVLCLGFQRWRQQRSNTPMSHSDAITYNMMVTELMSVSGCILSCCGLHTNHLPVMIVGIFLFSINLGGQMAFHILTCVERYLAVVHPITYRKLKERRGIRIRNISIGFAWMACFTWTYFVSSDYRDITNILEICFLATLFFIVSFCSISVLCVLVRPGPGGGGGGRQQADQSKLRAFYTITAILGLLLFRLGGILLSAGLFVTQQPGETTGCAAWLSISWFCLPSSLVLPVLFLQRAGKLLCCKNNNESGSD